MIPIPKLSRPALVFLVLILLGPGAAAFSVESVSVDPSGFVYPGNPVNVSYTVYVASGTPFSIYDDLQFTTELENPQWTYSIAVNGAKNTRPATGDRTITINGFELGYRNEDEVIVYVQLQGRIPSDAVLGSNRTLARVQELDSRGYSIPSTAVNIDHLVGEPTPTPTQAYGSISVASSPVGSNIYIDNVFKGLSPATFTGVPNGDHVVLVRMEGYNDWIKTATVSGDTQSLFADLSQKSASPLTSAAPALSQEPGRTAATPASSQANGFGSLSITTTPPGALVYVDGTMMGVTPATIPMLTGGPHSVTLIMDGYQDLKTTITINAGTTSEYITGLTKTKQSPGFSAGIAASAVAILFLYRKKGS